METDKVLWAELLPDELVKRISNCPIVYLPMGLCEPHGVIAAMGLDTIKAEYLCNESARRFGGVVAPTQGYHIHESGYHAAWLEEVCGNTTTFMTSIPPHVFLYQFLYQLRCFHNAGFKAAYILSGHSGGNQFDLRLAASIFNAFSDMEILIYSDPELVQKKHIGDHAGKYEISQLLYLRPDLVDFKKSESTSLRKSFGRFALGEDAHEATSDYGRLIIEDTLEYIKTDIEVVIQNFKNTERKFMNYDSIEVGWQQLLSQRKNWRTSKPSFDQKKVSSNSIWKSFEYLDLKNSHEFNKS